VANPAASLASGIAQARVPVPNTCTGPLERLRGMGRRVAAQGPTDLTAYPVLYRVRGTDGGVEAAEWAASNSWNHPPGSNCRQRCGGVFCDRATDV